jgi:3-oxoadipate CoA-transferase, beta subunit
MSGTPWTTDEMARLVAESLPDGSYVNLGIGMPTAVANFVPAGREVIYHSENGIVGMGPRPAPGLEDPDLIDAGKSPVTLVTGAAIVHHADSFAIIRGGRLDVAVLGGYQVSERGDLANWIIGNEPLGSIGGAMDLAAGAKALWVMMRHTDRDGGAKIVRSCTFQLTAIGCVRTVFTDLAVIDVTCAGLVVRQLAPGYTLEDVQKVTEPELRLAE